MEDQGIFEQFQIETEIVELKPELMVNLSSNKPLINILEFTEEPQET